MAVAVARGRAQDQVDTRAIELASQARQIADDAREECRREYEGLESDLRAYRTETQARFDIQDIERKAMHGENQREFASVKRIIHIALGVLLAASALMPHDGFVASLGHLIAGGGH